MLVILMFEMFWEDDDGYLKIEHFNGGVFAHSEIHNWNKAVLRKAQTVWFVAKEELLRNGFKQIHVLIPANDIKLIKFERMFGFVFSFERNNVLLMTCSTEK